MKFSKIIAVATLAAPFASADIVERFNALDSDKDGYIKFQDMEKDRDFKRALDTKKMNEKSFSAKYDKNKDRQFDEAEMTAADEDIDFVALFAVSDRDSNTMTKTIEGDTDREVVMEERAGNPGKLVVKQQRPEVTVTQPNPKVRVTQPAPVVDVNVTIPKPNIQTEVPDPKVNVNVKRPIVNRVAAQP